MNTFLFMNIQLLATQTTLLNSTGNDLSPEMKTYYDMTLIDEAQAMLVHDQFGQKRNIPKNGGKTIEFRKFSALPKALTPLTEGVTPNGNSLDVTTITATVKQFGDYIVQSDLLELTAIDNTILEATKLLGRQAGLTLDTVVRNILNAGTNVSYAPKVSSGSETEITSRAKLDTDCALTVDVINQAATKLRQANAPTINGDYVAIIHPYAAYELMRDSAWKDWNQYTSPEHMYEGEIGRINKVRFVESTEAKIFKGDDLASDTRTLLVNKQAGYSGTITSIDFDGSTAGVAVNALKDRMIIINGVAAKVTANTATTITVESTNFGTVADDDVIYPGEGGSDGGAVFSTLIIADGAYGTTEVEGGGLQTFVKQKGSAGTADPLDQRSSVGWKGLKTAEILVPAYMVRVESMSPRYSANAKAN